MQETAHAAYDAYCKYLLDHHDCDVEPWESITDSERNAWRAAMLAVIPQ